VTAAVGGSYLYILDDGSLSNRTSVSGDHVYVNSTANEVAVCSGSTVTFYDLSLNRLRSMSFDGYTKILGIVWRSGECYDIYLTSPYDYGEYFHVAWVEGGSIARKATVGRGYIQAKGRYLRGLKSYALATRGGAGRYGAFEADVGVTAISQGTVVVSGSPATRRGAHHR